MSRRFVTLVLAMALLAGAAGAQIITVPGMFPTIQMAIDAAVPGDTIQVSPGTYVEELIVDPGGTFYGTPHGPPNFTIEGTGPGVIIQWNPQAVRSAAWPNGIATTSGKQGDAIIWAAGVTGLSLKNLTFDGVGDMYSGASTTSTGIAFYSGVGTIENCTIMGVEATPPGGGQNGLGIYLDGAGLPGSTSVTISSCTLNTIQKSFIVIAYDAFALITGSTLTGRGPTATIAQNGIQPSYGGYCTIDGCTIDGFWWTGGNWTSSGILAYDPGNPIVINNCILRDCQTSVYWQSNTVTSIDLTVTNCDMSNIANAVDAYDGIDIYDNSGGLLAGGTWTIQNNTFNNLGGNGVWTNYGGGGAINGNYFNNCGATYGFVNAQDDSAGGNNWDGNTWSDYASNPGYPTPQYFIPGTAGAIDNNASGGCPDFTDSQVAVGTGPTDVILFDTEGDLDLDVVTANSLSDDLTILVNDGLGGFTLGSTIALTLGDAPSALVGGNLGTGLDLAVACQVSSDVKIFSTAGVAGPVIAAPGITSDPVALAIGDVDGSGADDLLVAYAGQPFTPTGGVALILNNGPAILLPAPVGGFLSMQDVVLSDLDGDGDLDAVATMADTLGGSTTSNVLLWENDGLGNLSYQGALASAQSTRGVSCYDLDDDGDMDLEVTVDAYPTASLGGLLVFLSGGLTPAAWNIPADFTALPVFQGGILPRDVECADLGDDSIPGFFSRRDVVTSNFGSGNVTTFKGFDGAGFAAINTCAVGQNPVALAIGELNGDFTPDVVYANITEDKVTVSLAVPQALAQNFGMGCAGTGGLIPVISAVGLPSFSSPTFAVKVTNARPYAPALLGISLGLLDTTLTGGCHLYLAPQIITFQLFTDFQGEATFTFATPPQVPGFIGLNAYFQWAIFDPAGSHAGFLAFSDALRIKFGQ